MPRLLSPRVVRLLTDAGADTTSTPAGYNFRTLLTCIHERLGENKVGGEDATEEQLHRLEAVRRLLLQEKAVHAGSWLWHRDAQVSEARAGTHGRLWLVARR